jgi:dienelactone hydrolase
VELVEKARSWLARRPEADVRRLAILGASMGGEFALVAASHFPWIRAVAAFTPSAFVTQGFAFGTGEQGLGSSWTVAGRPLAFLPQTGMAGEIAKYRLPGGEVRLASIRRAALKAASPGAIAAATIKVERSRAAFLLAGGGDDQTGASGDSVARIAERLRDHHYPRPVEVLIYPEAGHLIVGTGWLPTTSHNSGPSQDGGNAEADAKAQEDSWFKMLAFFRRELRPAGEGSASFHEKRSIARGK